MKEVPTEIRDENFSEIISEFASQIKSGEIERSADVDEMLEVWINEIDRLVSAQINEILHHPELQKLEGTWRGLYFLVKNSETGPKLQIRVFSVTKKELVEDFEQALDFDQSSIFKKIHEEVYGKFFGVPYGALIGDFEFGNHPPDLALLTDISHIAATAHTPFLSAASPDLFGWEDFSEMVEYRDISKLFDRAECMNWHSFRESEDSRYVGLTMPRVLGRKPYGADAKPTKTFNFEEDVSGKDSSKNLWSNAAYSLGTRLTGAYSKHGWAVAICGVEGGGLVDGLPYHQFETEWGVEMKGPVEVLMNDRREKELADNGFIPLLFVRGTDFAIYFTIQSAHKPKTYETKEANRFARLSSQLPYIFASSRFAHYLKAIVRDKVGGFGSREEIEVFLNSWIRNYVSAGNKVSVSEMAKRPLREARIDVAEVPGKPRSFRAVVFIDPFFQLEQLPVAMRIVVDLPKLVDE